MEWDGESELTADEAAEYMIYYTGREYFENRIMKSIGRKLWNNTAPKLGSWRGEKRLTAALNAAARAVYRRQG